MAIDIEAEVSKSGSASIAQAYPNIALIKYWGKRDAALHLPTTSSVSMTLDVCPTTTSVALQAAGDTSDTVLFDGRPAPTAFVNRVVRFLDVVRDYAGSRLYCRVESTNSIPTGAGLASSAAGFAALATAAVDAFGLQMTSSELSRLARRGSGSAARSIFAGFAIWHGGDGGTDRSSFAEELLWRDLDMAMVLVGVNVGAKTISSSEAMAHTVATSSLYWPWVEQSRKDLAEILVAGHNADLDEVGRIAERNALGMHATMLGADPAVRYMSPDTLIVLDHVQELRSRGVSAYVTMDAGPNVKIICPSGDRETVADSIRERRSDWWCETALPGPGAAVLDPIGGRL